MGVVGARASTPILPLYTGYTINFLDAVYSILKMEAGLKGNIWPLLRYGERPACEHGP